VTWHNAVLGGGPARLVLAGLEGAVARAADVTLGASYDLVARARRMGAADARLGQVAAPAVALPARSPDQVRADLGAGDRPLVLAVGRLAPQKAYDILLDAAARWRARIPQPLVLIAGEGPQRPLLQARIDADGLPVRLLGHRTDVADLLAAADVVVLTSRWEARALIAQEALQAGRPLVATAVGGVPDLVGDAALLVPYGDPDAISQAVSSVLDNPEIAKRLSEVGRAQAVSWADETAVIDAVLAVYRELAGNAGA
jgi:glycosyltransferase involved in cell wall biosynthesis